MNDSERHPHAQNAVQLAEPVQRPRMQLFAQQFRVASDAQEIRAQKTTPLLRSNNQLVSQIWRLRERIREQGCCARADAMYDFLSRPRRRELPRTEHTARILRASSRFMHDQTRSKARACFWRDCSGHTCRRNRLSARVARLCTRDRSLTVAESQSARRAAQHSCRKDSVLHKLHSACTFTHRVQAPRHAVLDHHFPDFVLNLLLARPRQARLHKASRLLRQLSRRRVLATRARALRVSAPLIADRIVLALERHRSFAQTSNRRRRQELAIVLCCSVLHHREASTAFRVGCLAEQEALVPRHPQAYTERAHGGLSKLNSKRPKQLEGSCNYGAGLSEQATSRH